MWGRSLIYSAVGSEDAILLSRWEETASYPRPRSMARWRSENSACGADVEQLFRKVIKGCSFELYQEKRNTEREVRRLSRAERLIAESEVDEFPKEPIYVDQVFLSEDGRRKPFRSFVPGEFLRHIHRGKEVEEETASARCFVGGFCCFVCKISYGVP